MVWFLAQREKAAPVSPVFFPAMVVMDCSVGEDKRDRDSPNSGGGGILLGHELKSGPVDNCGYFEKQKTFLI